MNPTLVTATSELAFNTHAVQNARRLARTAIETSSFFAIRGPQGVGKTFPYQLIANEWAEQKLACKPIYFKCVPERDPERFLRSLVQTVTGQKYAIWQRPSLQDLIELRAIPSLENQQTFYSLIICTGYATGRARCYYSSLTRQGIKALV